MAGQFEVTEQQMDAWIGQAMSKCRDIEKDRAVPAKEKAVYYGLWVRCIRYQAVKNGNPKNQQDIDQERESVQALFSDGDAHDTICVRWPMGPRLLTPSEKLVDNCSSVGRPYDRVVSLFVAYLLHSVV